MTHRSLRESTVRPTRALGPNRLGRRGLPPMAALLLTLLAAGCGGGADVDMTPDASTNSIVGASRLSSSSRGVPLACTSP